MRWEGEREEPLFYPNLANIRNIYPVPAETDGLG